jgi:hypothetical protein
MYGLGMLSQIIQSRKPPGTVTLKGPLARVLADMPGEMFAAREAQVARWEVGTEKSLAFFLLGWRGSAPGFALVVGSIWLPVRLVMHRVVGRR